MEASRRMKHPAGRAVEDRERLLWVSIPVLKPRDERDRVQRLLRAGQGYSSSLPTSFAASENDRSRYTFFVPTYVTSSRLLM